MFAPVRMRKHGPWVFAAPSGQKLTNRCTVLSRPLSEIPRSWYMQNLAAEGSGPGHPFNFRTRRRSASSSGRSHDLRECVANEPRSSDDTMPSPPPRAPCLPMLGVDAACPTDGRPPPSAAADKRQVTGRTCQATGYLANSSPPPPPAPTPRRASRWAMRERETAISSTVQTVSDATR